MKRAKKSSKHILAASASADGHRYQISTKVNQHKKLTSNFVSPTSMLKENPTDVSSMSENIMDEDVEEGNILIIV
jgi:hypothetical protein